MKIGDLVRYIDSEFSWAYRRAGLVKAIDTNDMIYVDFFSVRSGPYGFYARRLKLITPDELTDEECAALMEWKLTNA